MDPKWEMLWWFPCEKMWIEHYIIRYGCPSKAQIGGWEKGFECLTNIQKMCCFSH